MDRELNHKTFIIIILFAPALVYPSGKPALSRLPSLLPFSGSSSSSSSGREVVGIGRTMQRLTGQQQHTCLSGTNVSDGPSFGILGETRLRRECRLVRGQLAKRPKLYQ